MDVYHSKINIVNYRQVHPYCIHERLVIVQGCRNRGGGAQWPGLSSRLLLYEVNKSCNCKAVGPVGQCSAMADMLWLMHECVVTRSGVLYFNNSPTVDIG